MSWSVSAKGTAEEVCKELDRRCTTYTGQSKIEFDAALPHLKGLVSENFVSGKERRVELVANGSGSAKGDEQIERSCTITLKPLYE